MSFFEKGPTPYTVRVRAAVAYLLISLGQWLLWGFDVWEFDGQPYLRAFAKDDPQEKTTGHMLYYINKTNWRIGIFFPRGESR